MKQIQKRILAIVVLLVVVAGAAIMTTRSQTYEPASDTAKTPKSAWVTRCDDIKDGDKVTGQYCEAAQTISVTPKGKDASAAQRLAELAIGYPPGSKGKANGVLILPLGVAVNKPIALEIDGAKFLKFDLQYCNPAGCYGKFAVGDTEIAKLRKGREVVIKTTLFNDKPLYVGLSLTGLGAALDAIKPKK